MAFVGGMCCVSDAVFAFQMTHFFEGRMKASWIDEE